MMVKGKYRHLNLTDRIWIQRCKAKGMSIRQVAKWLGINPSTVSRELRRNDFMGVYTAENAHKLYQARKYLATTNERKGSPARAVFPPIAGRKRSGPDRLLVVWASDDICDQYWRYGRLSYRIYCRIRRKSLYHCGIKPINPTLMRPALRLYVAKYHPELYRKGLYDDSPKVKKKPEPKTETRPKRSKARRIYSELRERCA
ncbi:hypothetical protein FUAX_17890 [Fulvitalea axinellae]|uniref:Transposase IS30-like HTH domain-containing protein n=1 Tax=Fulvitalea axinellae TaxID=1182444 RepID=A0AAU9CN52_9BACT|nr:hypothetical protein FUAX_17890 [Fulvitalea axinellae]